MNDNEDNKVLQLDDNNQELEYAVHNQELEFTVARFKWKDCWDSSYI